jgi:hypothetical protein
VTKLREDHIDSSLEPALASFPVRLIDTKNVFLNLSAVSRIVRRIFLRLKLLDLGQVSWIDSQLESFAAVITFLNNTDSPSPTLP